MAQRHFTIPVFIPMEACPFRCIYCDQVKISGQQKIPSTADVQAIINRHLITIPFENNYIEVGFFGGTFTGLKLVQQEDYLLAVQPYIKAGKIKSIRLSTRPDFIDQPNIDLLKKYNVTTIELGAQSMDDEVLRASGRGHTVTDVSVAAQLIRLNGFRLGLQMMIGLPGDTREKSLFTAKRFIELGAEDVRIYPTLVIKGTHLEKQYKTGKYLPLSLDEAVSVIAEVLLQFERSHVNVIRVGLHPSEGLLRGDSLVDGPFHVSFRELVLSKIWGDLLGNIPAPDLPTSITITVSSKELNYAIGFKAVNRKMLENKFSRVIFRTSEFLIKREFHVDYHR
ncbi:MAG: radical SAM protein [Bacteroidales bacterium]|nr:radical SAM protein [Bacteroidales bacterium]